MSVALKRLSATVALSIDSPAKPHISEHKASTDSSAETAVVNQTISGCSAIVVAAQAHAELAPLFSPGNQFPACPRRRFCHHGCRQSQRRYLREFCSFSLGSPMSPMESQHPSEQLVALTVVWHAEMSAGPSVSCSTTLWKSRLQQPPVETWR
jgi:hypothetical protein